MYFLPKKLVILGLFTLMYLTVKSQDANYVLAFGKFKIEWGDTDNSKIILFEDDKQIDTYNPESNGKFQFSLELNHVYMFWFSKPGYVTKKVQFNTYVPSEVTSDPEFIPFPDFDFYVTLFQTYPDVDTMFFTKPVGKIQFNATINDFDWDKNYTLEIQRSIEQIEKEITQKHDKEVQELAEKEKLAAQQAIDAQEAKKQADKQLEKDKLQQEIDAKQKEKEKLEAERLIALETAKKLADEKEEQEKIKQKKEAEKKAEQKLDDTEKSTDSAQKEVIEDVKTEPKKTEPAGVVETPKKDAEPQKTMDEQKNIEKPKENTPIEGTSKNTSKPSPDIMSATKIGKVDKIEATGKTTTRTQITENEITLTYIKVEYTWGGKYYFIEDENNVFRNISEFYYNTMMSRKQ